jgi:hypothetical protein
MAALRNQRRELFAQAVVKGAKNGVNLTEAYKQAGYRGDDHVAEVGASRLMSTDEVRTRIAELTAPAARKAGLTVERLLDEIERTINDARQAKQHGVVVSCLTLAGRLVGLLRTEVVVGSPSEYAACESMQDVARQYLGDASLSDVLAFCDEWRDALIKAAAERAMPVN